MALIDKDIKTFWDERLVSFTEVGTIPLPLGAGKIRIQALIGGGKTNTALPFRQNCFSTGLKGCLATRTSNYLEARMAARILEEADLPFFRVGNALRDHVV